jgi:hypothetical protein
LGNFFTMVTGWATQNLTRCRYHSCWLIII